MSTAMVAHVLRLSNPNLTRACQRLLLVLAHHYNEHTGLCCPGHRLLARELLVTARQIKRLVHDAVKAGFLEVIPGQGRGHLSTFRLKLGLPEVIPRKGDISRNDAPVKGDILGQDVPEKGTFCAPPLYEVEQEKEKTEQRNRRSLAREKPEAANRFWCAECGYSTPTCAHRVVEVARSTPTGAVLRNAPAREERPQ